MWIIFMRVFKNFKQYEKFLDDKREIAKLLQVWSWRQWEFWGVLTENNDDKEIKEAEEVQDEALEREEEKKKAKHRKRGPYRKAHANW